VSAIEPQKKPDGRGGRRPGAGRPPVRHRLDAVSLRERFPVWPIEHMLEVLNEPRLQLPNFPQQITEQTIAKYNSEHADYVRQRTEKLDAAKGAAPFLHPRLAAIDITQKPQVRHKLDLTKLSDEELKQLEHITVKAQMTFVEDQSDVEDGEFNEIKETP
jgi:hypothetical protein